MVGVPNAQVQLELVDLPHQLQRTPPQKVPPRE